ncbi:PREDICTED: immunoglobulin omega chain-like, partial [Myotis brandtii]|uniref:immunoglobulin omega chain-like n=1 Tax=Myotis brandtii TaxID=109478 RepID=UPI0007047B4C
MAWAPLLLLLLAHCTGSLSQPVLTQPLSLSASPGASARLSCSLSSGSVVAGYHISWFQQKPGSPPRFLLRYKSDSDKTQGSGVPSYFSGTKDASANAGLLLISGLQPEDEAEYYCATFHGNSNTYTVPQGHGEVSLKPSACPSCPGLSPLTCLEPRPTQGAPKGSLSTEAGSAITTFDFKPAPRGDVSEAGTLSDWATPLRQVRPMKRLKENRGVGG